ncbi:Isochorismatase-like protein [Aspergillus karnatakaensis]|uniref:Isochorismatase-like protein n=1 Tax=Aspergillus karnatakaensis TaxID=1810916 RepID=UPI003CCD1610
MPSQIEHAASASYARSGFSNRMGWGKRPALLLVDVCKAYWSTDSPLSLLGNPPAVEAPDVMRRLLASARAGNVPVVWSKVEYSKPDMADAGLFWLKSKTLDVWKKGDIRGFDGWLQGLEPAEGDVVISKKYASSFFATTLATELQTLNVDTLVICGVSTSGCVRATTLDAMQCGFRPMVVGTACGDRSPEIQNANLFDLDAKYADVVAEEEAVSHLKAGWGSH